jgi:two-component system, LytTR family, sensor kinase
MRLHDFIFSNKTSIRIWRHVSFWVGWYVYQVTLFLYNNTNIQNSFWQTLKVRCEKLIVVISIGMIQCYIVVYWLIPKFLLKKRYFLFVCGVIISSAGVMFLVDLYTLTKFNFEMGWLSIISYISRAGPSFCGVFIMIKMLKTWYIKEKEKETLLNENLNAELQLLKAQVHPHFLFNTLNNIYSFILSNPPKARGLVRKLDKMLQYMINECEQPLVPLSKEINFIKDYLGLEKVRYGNRLDINVEITSDGSNKS